MIGCENRLPLFEIMLQADLNGLKPRIKNNESSSVPRFAPLASGPAEGGPVRSHREDEVKLRTSDMGLS
jgi:hypothetical protein